MSRREGEEKGKQGEKRPKGRNRVLQPKLGLAQGLCPGKLDY